MTTMTDSKALEVIRANLAPYATHTEKDRAVEHVAARLREPAGVEAMPGLRSELSEIVHRHDADMVTIEPNEAAAILRALAQPGGAK